LIAWFHYLLGNATRGRFFREAPATSFLLKRNRPGFDPALWEKAGPKPDLLFVLLACGVGLD